MPSPKTTSFIAALLVTSMALVFLSGCRADPTLPGSQTPDTGTAAFTDEPTATATVTATPEPMALTVNGEGVPLAEYEAQWMQLQAADAELGKTRSPEEQRQLVLDELINQTLLAQAAVEGGFQIDDAGLQERIDALAADLGGQAALDAWMAANGYSPVSFRSAMRRAAASAWQRDALINAVPERVEQVRVQQILVRQRDTADGVIRQLDAGADFATLAAKYDPTTGGMLGWFPRGYLTQPAVEEAAFALQPGEHSPVVETDFGYHIIYVLERESDRILSVDARLTLQHLTLDSWLETRRSASTVEILLP